MRKLSAYLLVVFVSLTVLSWTARSATAEVPPGFEPKSELAIPVNPATSPPTEDSRVSLPGNEISADDVEVNTTNPEPGVFGRIRTWLDTHGLATAKGAGVGLLVGGLVAAGALALGVAGAPILLIVGAGVLGGAIYGASVGNADFNWLEAGASALLSSITTLAGGVAVVSGRASVSGASAVGRGLIGGIARGASGGSVRSGIVNAVLDAVDAYETVAVVTDEEASWHEKAITALGVLPFGQRLRSLKKAPLSIIDIDNIPKHIRDVGASKYARKLGLKGFTRRNYREALIKHTGRGDPGSGFHAHRIFPKELEHKFNEIFDGTDFSIHDPRFMAWWDKNTHLHFKDAYNRAWREFLEDNPNPTPEEAIEAAREIIAEFKDKALREGGTLWSSPNSMFGELLSGGDPFMLDRLKSM